MGLRHADRSPSGVYNPAPSHCEPLSLTYRGNWTVAFVLDVTQRPAPPQPTAGQLKTVPGSTRLGGNGAAAELNAEVLRLVRLEEP